MNSDRVGRWVLTIVEVRMARGDESAALGYFEAALENREDVGVKRISKRLRKEVSEEEQRWFCFNCGAELPAVDASCSRCLPDQQSSSAEESSTQEDSTDNISHESDTSVPMMYCSKCGEEISEKAKSCPNCGAPQKSDSDTSRVTAALLAFFLGGIGVHRFYIGRTWHGVLMLLFFWTFIPAIIAFIDFIRFLIMSDQEFAERYG